ncbi:hypothetical protein CANARDRAFT_23253 [[Candida] arabinofermentans NRRL YB-2248]|uniref:Uncharacterized protein n=1 Tax=[Candida] arabinofermentans NRRL YB-2248 TaxID=983967 RepID=A0A1E4T090_9ASCO|nr:hypothetical protein CANARDRAFT_23253 [[Candida] arabinofermentans NRRL YB-2248]
MELSVCDYTNPSQEIDDFESVRFDSPYPEHQTSVDIKSIFGSFKNYLTSPMKQIGKERNTEVSFQDGKLESMTLEDTQTNFVPFNLSIKDLWLASSSMETHRLNLPLKIKTKKYNTQQHHRQSSQYPDKLHKCQIERASMNNENKHPTQEETYSGEQLSYASYFYKKLIPKRTNSPILNALYAYKYITKFNQPYFYFTIEEFIETAEFNANEQSLYLEKSQSQSRRLQVHEISAIVLFMEHLRLINIESVMEQNYGYMSESRQMLKDPKIKSAIMKELSSIVEYLEAVLINNRSSLSRDKYGKTKKPDMPRRTSIQNENTHF